MSAPREAHVVYSSDAKRGDGLHRALMSENSKKWAIALIDPLFPKHQPIIEAAFDCDEVADLAKRIMAGDRDVLKTPGLARKLAAYSLLRLMDAGDIDPALSANAPTTIQMPEGWAE